MVATRFDLTAVLRSQQLHNSNLPQNCSHTPLLRITVPAMKNQKENELFCGITNCETNNVSRVIILQNSKDDW